MRDDDDNWQRLGDVVERVVSRARNKGGSRQGEEREETCRLPTRTVEGSPSRSGIEGAERTNRPASERERLGGHRGLKLVVDNCTGLPAEPRPTSRPARTVGRPLKLVEAH